MTSEDESELYDDQFLEYVSEQEESLEKRRRKLSTEDIQFLKKKYHHLHDVKGLSQTKSLEKIEKEDGIPPTTARSHLFGSDFGKILEKKMKKNEKLREVIKLVEKNERLWKSEYGPDSKYCTTIGKKGRLNPDYVQLLRDTHQQASEITEFSNHFFIKLIENKCEIPYTTAYSNLLVFTDTDKHENALKKKRDEYERFKEEDPKEYKKHLKKMKKRIKEYHQNPENHEDYLKWRKEWYKKWYRTLKKERSKEYEEYLGKDKERKSKTREMLKMENSVKYRKRLADERKRSVGWREKRKERIESLEERIENIQNQIITLQDLSKAMAHKVGGRKFRQYMDSANIVMDYFWPDDRTIDNRLSLEDRQLFYLLEEMGFLVTDRDETYISSALNDPDFGKAWKSNFWRLDKREILNCELKYERWYPKERPKEDFSIYDSDEIWIRSQT